MFRSGNGNELWRGQDSPLSIVALVHRRDISILNEYCNQSEHSAFNSLASEKVIY